MKIEKLKIFTPHFREQLHFYRDILGLEILQRQEEMFLMKAGFSQLLVQHDPRATPYHIAFHIPAHQEEMALDWLKQRVSILPDEGEEIVDFPSWNARSVYFHDSDKNILEFISRKHCFPAVNKIFDSGSIVGISEIGLATKQVRETFDFLNRNFGMKKFTGDYEVFCATGDEIGLFIVIDKNKKNWFPSGDKAYSSNFEIRIATELQSAEMAFNNDRLGFL